MSRAERMTIEAYGFVFTGRALDEHLPDCLATGSGEAAVEVSFSAASVPASPQRWVDAQDESVRVGWGGFVDYELLGRPLRAAAVVSDTEEPRHALLGLFVAALPLALPHWGIEPLHASVVAQDGRAVAAV